MELEFQSRKSIVFKKNNLEGWDIFVSAMYSGKKIEIDQEMYFYWMGLLSPLNQGVDFFTFAEGIDYIIRFWRESRVDSQDKYYCQNTLEVNGFQESISH